MESVFETTPAATAAAVATHPLSRRTVWFYALGQAAEGIKNYAFTTFLLFYYTSVIGLSGSLAGAALMLALVFDAVTDPIVAVLSDRTHSRWGRRHPYIVFSALPLGAFFYLTFVPPSHRHGWFGVGRETALFTWLAMFAILTRGAMTLFHVPHMALGAELSDDFDERTRVVTARSLLAVIATALSVTGYFVLVALMQTPDYPDGRLNPAPYGVYAALFGVVMAVAVLTSAWGTRDRIAFLQPPDDAAHSRGVFAALLTDSAEALRIRSFRALFFGFTLCFLAWGVTNALGAHNALYLWHVSVEQQGLWGLFVLFGILAGMSFWQRVARRSDKKPTFLLGLAWFTVFAAVPPFLKVADWLPAEGTRAYAAFFYASGFLGAFGIASAMVVVGSMMADITDEDDLLHGRRREGIFFGALSFAGKAATGLGVVIAGAVYDGVGLYQGLDPVAAPPSVATHLGIVSGGVILVLVTLSLAFFRNYDLTRERQAEIHRALERRKSSKRA
jgi:Na+/melibiose symporter-like transporter